MKKFLLILLVLLLMVSFVGCKGKNDNNISDDPVIVQLTEERALEYVQSIYENPDVIQWMGPVENLKHLIAMFKYDVDIFKTFMEKDDFEKNENGKSGFSVAALQKRVDEVFGTGRFKITELFGEYIIDGYVMFEPNSEAFDFPEVHSAEYSVYKATDKYIVIEKLSAYDTEYNGKVYTTELKDLVVVYPTDEGLKLWDCQVGFAGDDLPLNYLPTDEYIIDNQDTDKAENKNYFSTDWQEFSFKLDGVIYTYPWSFAQLEKQGWLPDTDPNKVIEAHELNLTYYIEMTNEHQDYSYVDDDFLWIRVQNRSGEDKTIRDSQIVFMNFHILSDWENNKVMYNPYNLELANGVSWFASEAEIIAAFGPVEDGNRSVTSEILGDEFDAENDYDSVMLRYSFNDGTTDGWLLLTIREDVGLCSISFHRSPINFENLD